MKRTFCTLFAALVCVSAAFAGNGSDFYIGAGAACQVVPVMDGTRYSAAPVVEFGVKSNYLNLGVAGSVNGEAMVSVDANGNFMMNNLLDVILGCGFGGIYRETEHTEGFTTYRRTGFIAWPHVNFGVEFFLSERFGLRMVGAFGYVHSNGGGGYGDYHYSYDGWDFASQARASLVWYF